MTTSDLRRGYTVARDDDGQGYTVKGAPAPTYLLSFVLPTVDPSTARLGGIVLPGGDVDLDVLRFALGTRPGATALLLELTPDDGHTLEHVVARYRVTHDGRVMVSRYPVPHTTAEREAELGR